MKKISMINSVLSIIILFLVWIPFTRVFLLDSTWGNAVTVLSASLLIISSIWAYRKEKSIISILFLSVGFSPLIFLVLALIAYNFNPMP